MSQPAVLSLGSANMDIQLRVPRRPGESETLLADRFHLHGGGKAANVAFLARRLGVPARLIARIGDDEHGRQVLAPLRDAGVDLGATSRAADAPTGVAVIAVPPDGKKGIIQAGNANRRWDGPATAAAVLAVREAARGSVLVADYEVPAEVVAACVDAAAGRLTVVLDPSPADLVEDRVLRQVGLVLPNPGEAEKLTDVPVKDAASAHRAGEALVRRGAGAAAVKLPDGGAVLVGESAAIYLRPVPVEVEDTTGAGDAFAGAAAVALLRGASLLDAVCHGSAAAHLAVQGWGSQPAYPGREALEAMLVRIREGADAL